MMPWPCHLFGASSGSDMPMLCWIMATMPVPRQLVGASSGVDIG
jgi:hypothetical protein